MCGKLLKAKLLEVATCNHGNNYKTRSRWKQ